MVYPPKLVQAWIEAETINDLLANHGFEGEIDLFSLDMDGVDYWIWKSIEVVEPRVVVLEYQDIIGPERRLTVPYARDFQAEYVDGAPDYAGASLAAFAGLATEKGYRLVGCERLGFNAFFVKRGVGEDVLPEVTVKSCFTHPRVADGMERRWPRVSNRDWTEV